MACRLIACWLRVIALGCERCFVVVSNMGVTLIGFPTDSPASLIATLAERRVAPPPRFPDLRYIAKQDH